MAHHTSSGSRVLIAAIMASAAACVPASEPADDILIIIEDEELNPGVPPEPGTPGNPGVPDDPVEPEPEPPATSVVVTARPNFLRAGETARLGSDLSPRIAQISSYTYEITQGLGVIEDPLVSNASARFIAPAMLTSNSNTVIKATLTDTEGNVYEGTVTVALRGTSAPPSSGGWQKYAEFGPGFTPYVTMASSGNTPLVGYQDGTSSDTSDRPWWVMKWNGSEWKPAQNPNVSGAVWVTPSSRGAASVGTDDSGHPFCAYFSRSGVGIIESPDGFQWQQTGRFVGQSSGSDPAFARSTPAGQLAMTYNAGYTRALVSSDGGASWAPVGGEDGGRRVLVNDTGSGQLLWDPVGAQWVMLMGRDDALTAMRYDPVAEDLDEFEDDGWVYLGQPDFAQTNVGGERDRPMAFLQSANGTFYAAVGQRLSGLELWSFDGGQWQRLADHPETGRIADLHMGFDTNGDPVLVYRIDPAGSGARVVRAFRLRGGTSWTQIGSNLGVGDQPDSMGAMFIDDDLWVVYDSNTSGRGLITARIDLP